MKKNLISYINGFIALILGFQTYLNLTKSEEISYEKSLHILKYNFIAQPLLTTVFMLAIILISIFAVFITNKVLERIIFKERRIEATTKSSIDNYSKREKYRDSFFDRMFNEGVNFMDSQVEPWRRLKSEFHKIIVRDINDKSFPELGNWTNMETFNLTKDGIEFFDGCNVTGFRLYFDEKYNWDVLHYNDKIKKGNFTRATKAYCIDFLPYENIRHIEWTHDDFYGNITVLCPFKFASNGVKHPFAEFRYYVENSGFLMLLDESKRRNFKPLIHRLKYKLVDLPLKRFKRGYL